MGPFEKHVETHYTRRVRESRDRINVSGVETVPFDEMSGKFDLGKVVATPGALRALRDSGDNGAAYIRRHASGDWGDVGPGDSRLNDQAVKEGSRILSSYELSDGTKLWIITEWDRSVTTLLLPSEY